MQGLPFDHAVRRSKVYIMPRLALALELKPLSAMLFNVAKCVSCLG